MNAIARLASNPHLRLVPLALLLLLLAGCGAQNPMNPAADTGSITQGQAPSTTDGQGELMDESDRAGSAGTPLVTPTTGGKLTGNAFGRSHKKPKKDWTPPTQ